MLFADPDPTGRRKQPGSRPDAALSNAGTLNVESLRPASRLHCGPLLDALP